MFRVEYRWLLCLSLVVLLVASAVIPVFANQLEEKMEEQAEIERRLQEERDNLKQQRNREMSLKQELEQLNRRLEALQQEKKRLEKEISRIEEEIFETEAELAEAEELLAMQDSLFKQRIRTIYEQGSVTYLEVLFNATSFSDFLTRLNNLKAIAANDLRLLEEIQAERDRIQLIKETLEQKKEELEEMRRQVLVNEQEIEEATETRRQVLEELQAEIARNIKAIEELEKEAYIIAQQIYELGGGTPGSGPAGKLHWPIAAPYVITSPFGWRSDPFSGAKAWHGGLDIAPLYGLPNNILAADSGMVILARWNGGYGNCIMINHGNGLVTAYGHMSQLLVSEGTWVSRGQVIGKAGTTGYSTGVHLHFEVWDYNKPPLRSGYPNDRRHNPMSYL